MVGLVFLVPAVVIMKIGMKGLFGCWIVFGSFVRGWVLLWKVMTLSCLISGCFRGFQEESGNEGRRGRGSWRSSGEGAAS